MKLYGIFSLGLLSLALGCSGGGAGGPAIVPVDGIVTLNGNPMEGATVVFSPKKEGTMSMAVTDAEGKFVLRTGSGKKGAAVGDHDVTVQLTVTAEAPAAGSSDGLAPAMPSELGIDPAKVKAPKTGAIIPERYGKPGALSATVPAGGLSGHKLELSK